MRKSFSRLVSGLALSVALGGAFALPTIVFGHGSGGFLGAVGPPGSGRSVVRMQPLPAPAVVVRPAAVRKVVVPIVVPAPARRSTVSLAAVRVHVPVRPVAHRVVHRARPAVARHRFVPHARTRPHARIPIVVPAPVATVPVAPPAPAPAPASVSVPVVVPVTVPVVETQPVPTSPAATADRELATATRTVSPKRADKDKRDGRSKHDNGHADGQPQETSPVVIPLDVVVPEQIEAQPAAEQPATSDGSSTTPASKVTAITGMETTETTETARRNSVRPFSPGLDVRG